MTDQSETWEDRRARVAERKAAFEALPEEAKLLLEGMHFRLVSAGRDADYAELKRLVLELWGPK
jgi:hypothetical protein